MFSHVGPTPPPPNSSSTIPIPWSATSLDVNFDGTLSAAPALRGYDDWSNIDLRQIGATGSDFLGGGGKNTIGGGKNTIGGGKNTIGGGKNTIGGGKNTIGGGVGEINHETANSVVRPPRNLISALLSTTPRQIQLNWMVPTFGQISSYNIYRAANGVPAAPPLYTLILGTSFIDKNVHCGPTYTYFVTAVIADTIPPRESASSNSVSQMACAPPYTFTGFFSPLSPAGDSSNSGAFNIGKSVTSKWTLQDSSGKLVGNLNANTVFAVGPVPLANGACPLPSQVPKVFNSTAPPPFATLYSPTIGAKGNTTFRISTSNNQFILNWDTTPFSAGCYVLEVDLDSGQVERTALKLQ
jgi:hypothetical protein